MTQLSSQAGSASRTTLAAASPSNVPPQSEHNNFQGVCQERDLDHGQADRIRQAIFMRTSDIRGISGHNYFSSLAYTKEIIQHIPRKKKKYRSQPPAPPEASDLSSWVDSSVGGSWGASRRSSLAYLRILTAKAKFREIWTLELVTMNVVFRASIQKLDIYRVRDLSDSESPRCSEEWTLSARVSIAGALRLCAGFSPDHDRQCLVFGCLCAHSRLCIIYHHSTPHLIYIYIYNYLYSWISWVKSNQI